jgi:RHS repeat-associated protein
MNSACRGDTASFRTTSGVSVAFYTCDANGNVSLLLGPDIASVVAQYEYDAYGTIVSATGAMATANAFRFSAKYQDDETGFYYYGYRYYSPNLGRWFSRDPIGEGGGCNLYCFVHNRPTSIFDILGREPSDETQLTGSGLAILQLGQTLLSKAAEPGVP